MLLRVAGIPVGRVDLPALAAARFDGALSGAITTIHADCALRAALAAWIRQAPVRGGFQLERAFDALRQSASDAHAQAPAQQGPGLTVVVCTRDRPRQGARALNALAALLRHDDELLVVLNAPAPQHEALEQHHFPSARFVVEPRPGLDWARNRALLECRTDVVLFTDDDCVPDPNWVEAQRALFEQNPDIDVATGLVEPLELATTAQQQLERYGGLAHGYRRRWISAPRMPRVAGAVGNAAEYGAGANFGVRRRLIARIGPFDAALGAGTSSRAGDEIEFLFRALKSGALLAYEPRAIILHEHRRELEEMEAQVAGWSQGFACAMERSILAFPEERTAYRVLRARIALLYHVRRALLHPSLRRLALAELRGLRGSGRQYARARAEAERIAASIPSPAQDASPYLKQPAALPRARTEGQHEQVTVDLDRLTEPLRFGNHVDDVTVLVQLRGQPLGAVTLRVFNGAVGVDRLFDAAIDQFGGTIVGAHWGAAVKSTRRYLAAAVRP